MTRAAAAGAPTREGTTPMAEPRSGAVLVASAALVAGTYLVLRHRPVRRVAWQLARIAATTWLPAWIGAEVRAAWHAAAREPEPGAGA